MHYWRLGRQARNLYSKQVQPPAAKPAALHSKDSPSERYTHVWMQIQTQTQIHVTTRCTEKTLPLKTAYNEFLHSKDIQSHKSIFGSFHSKYKQIKWGETVSYPMTLLQPPCKMANGHTLTLYDLLCANWWNFLFPCQSSFWPKPGHSFLLPCNKE